MLLIGLVCATGLAGVVPGPAASFMMRRLEASRAQALKAERMLLPTIASSSVWGEGERADENCDAFAQRLRLSTEQLRALVLRQPTVLAYTPSAAQESLDALSRRLSLGDKPEVLRKMVLKHPAIVGYALDATCAALQRELGLTDAELTKIAVGMPSGERRQSNPGLPLHPTPERRQYVRTPRPP